MTSLRLAALMAAAATLAVPALAPSEAQAAALSCRANVALNRVYDVQLEDETGEMVVVNDTGTRLAGRANSYFSSRTGNTTWFLATGFAQGVELEIEAAGQQRVALCLADNECYLCRR
jgi:hypothetical protein